MTTANSDKLAETLEMLRREVAQLGARVAALENRGAARPTAAAPAAAATAPAEEPISPEILVVISAAVAAFLGKKPHIRQIRLVGGASWAQQGRATIQASHSRMAWHGRNQS